LLYCPKGARPEPTILAEWPVKPAVFRGSLDEIALASLLFILEMERKTGVLVLILEPNLERARLHLREGRMVRAHLDRKEEPRNDALVYTLLACTRGTFDFRPCDVVLGDEIPCSTSQLIFEGARRIDEAGLAPPSELILSDGKIGDVLETIDLEKGLSLEGLLPLYRGSQDEGASVERWESPGLDPAFPRKRSRSNKEGTGALGPEKRGAKPNPIRRLNLANASFAALSVAAFVVVVLMAAFHSGQAAPDSLSPSPADASTNIRGSGVPSRP
jgi:hypothetical protein